MWRFKRRAIPTSLRREMRSSHSTNITWLFIHFSIPFCWTTTWIQQVSGREVSRAGIARTWLPTATVDGGCD